MKRIFVIVLALLLLMMMGCAQSTANTEEPNNPTVSDLSQFTDSLGRTAEIPQQIDRIAVTGPMTQIIVFALCPDKLVGLSSAWSDDAAQYLAPEYYNLPELGQLYGGKGDMNPETLLALEPQIILDIGESKDGMAEELDDLQAQLGIPVLHIDAATATYGDTYRMLGDLLSMQDEAETLARYCDETYEATAAMAETVEKVDALYITGENGLNVIAKGAYHAEIMDLLTNNLAIVDDPSSRGTGNEVDLEQIMNWDPDVIIFSPDSIYATVADDPAWQNVSAVKSGSYYEVPEGPYNWMGFPPSVQRYLGMLWLSSVLYPNAAEYDLRDAVTEYYDLFYHCELTDAQYNALTEHAIP
ncbi:MAG: ABC transporter substrate-binding protein [Oscillospiraceae bacterium]|nr:ABC transporter substrate-binding protein [Oscillospiraceae bacterium]